MMPVPQVDTTNGNRSPAIWTIATMLLALSFIGLLYMATGIFALRRGQAGSAFFVSGALAIISSIIFGAAGYLNPGSFNQDIAGHFGRYALLFEAFVFALAILLHILGMRHERDAVLQREIATTHEKLAISEALVAAQHSHSRAVALAKARRTQLASTAHDIQQPLSCPVQICPVVRARTTLSMVRSKTSPKTFLVDRSGLIPSSSCTTFVGLQRGDRDW